MNFRWTVDYLAKQQAQGLFRELVVRPDKLRFNFASNDYLNLSQAPAVVAAATNALDLHGAGAGASRLVSGTLPEHRELERALADWLGTEDALVFGAGYLANLGTLSACAGRGDYVIADRLVHASLIDGARLSGAEMIRYQHNNCEDLLAVLQRVRQARKPESRVLLVTESVFSMDGDLAPLDEMLKLTAQFEVDFLVDEAHAVGVFGESGRGLLGDSERSSGAVAISGTLSKALGSYGGFVCQRAAVVKYLTNFARPFMFNTALPPSAAAAGAAAIKIITDDGGEAGVRLLERAAEFRRALTAGGLDTLQSNSQIVPVVVGEAEKTLEFGRRLLARGLLVAAVRPPTVPPNTSRLRFSLTAEHSAADLAEAAAIVLETAAELQVLK